MEASEAAAAEQQKQHKNWVTTQRSNDESPAEVLEKSGGFAWGSHDRPAAEVLLEGEEYGAETEDVAGSSDAAAAVGMRPPRPVDWAAAGAAGAAKDGQMGNASAEEPMMASGGAAEDGPGAPACDHAWASSGGTLRRSTVRRGHWERGRGCGRQDQDQKKSGSNMEGGHVEFKVMVGPSAAWGPNLL